MAVADLLLLDVLEGVTPGNALDLACGDGRHAIWLAERGHSVTAVDQTPGRMPESIKVIAADLETHEYRTQPDAWNLILCWLYWQADLMPSIAAGLAPGGVVALAGKTTGRFTTSLANYREAFAGWHELVAGEDGARAWFIARKPERKQTRLL